MSHYEQDLRERVVMEMIKSGGMGPGGNAAQVIRDAKTITSFILNGETAPAPSEKKPARTRRS